MFGAITIPELIIFLWTIISTLFYIILLCQLIKRRHQEPFDAQFFTHFVSIGCADLGNIFSSHTFSHFKSWGWVDWAPIQLDPVLGWWFHVLGFATGFYFTWSQYIGVMQLAINRFYQIVHSYEIERRFLVIAIFLQWSLPVFSVIPFLTQNYTLLERNFSGNSYLFAAPPMIFLTIYNLISGFILPTIVNVIVSILYVRMYLNVRNLIEEHNLERRTHMKLALLGFVLFILMAILELILIVYAISVALGHADVQSLVAKLGHHVIVLFSLSNPWLLVVNLRRLCYRLLSSLQPK